MLDDPRNTDRGKRGVPPLVESVEPFVILHCVIRSVIECLHHLTDEVETVDHLSVSGFDVLGDLVGAVSCVQITR